MVAVITAHHAQIMTHPAQHKNTFIPRQVNNISLKPWQQYIVDHANNSEDDYHINFLVDAPDTYSISFLSIYYMGCRNLARHIPPSVGGYKDLMSFVFLAPSSSCYLIHEPRFLSDGDLYMFYYGVKMLKNGYAFDVKNGFREKSFEPPNVWVFGKKIPDMQKLQSPNRWIFWKIDEEEKLQRLNLP